VTGHYHSGAKVTVFNPTRYITGHNPTGAKVTGRYPTGAKVTGHYPTGA